MLSMFPARWLADFRVQLASICGITQYGLILALRAKKTAPKAGNILDIERFFTKNSLSPGHLTSLMSYKVYEYEPVLAVE